MSVSPLASAVTVISSSFTDVVLLRLTIAGESTDQVMFPSAWLPETLKVSPTENLISSTEREKPAAPIGSVAGEAAFTGVGLKFLPS